MRNKWIKCLLVASALIISQISSAAPIRTFEFTIDGFENGGSITGRFTGEDKDGDGYLSSFIFSQDVDMDGSGFENGFADNEVISASATFNGKFPDPVTGELVDTTFDSSNDLTNIDDLFFGLFPQDLFFVLNYKIGSGSLGDDKYEGILIGQADGFGPIGLGTFLPAPLGILFDSINGLPGGSSLTSALINDSSMGKPCDNSTCGVVHTVVPTIDGSVAVGASALTNSFAIVREVNVPASGLLMLSSMLGLFFIRRRWKSQS